MTTITTSIASLRTVAHLDTRAPGRYQPLQILHGRIRHAAELEHARCLLAAEFSHRRIPATCAGISQSHTVERSQQ